MFMLLTLTLMSLPVTDTGRHAFFQDVIDLRGRGWIPRNAITVAVPTTIDQVDQSLGFFPGSYAIWYQSGRRKTVTCMSRSQTRVCRWRWNRGGRPLRAPNCTMFVFDGRT